MNKIISLLILFFVHTAFATVVYNNPEATGNLGLPPQSGHAGEFLTTDGSTVSWAAGGGGGGSGTVTSVALTAPSAVFAVAGSPITTSGTLAITFQTQTANTVFAGPTGGGAATPTFRALVAADVPTLNQNTTGTASNVTGVVAIANGGTGQTTAANAINALVPTQTGNSGKFLSTDGSVVSWQTGGSGANTTLSNLVNTTAVPVDLSPATDGDVTPISLGTASKRWRTLWAQIISNNGAGDMYISNSSSLGSGNEHQFIGGTQQLLTTGTGASLNLLGGGVSTLTGQTGLTLAAGSGDIRFTAPGDIYWIDGTEGTSGQCLVSSGTGGKGVWTTCPGGGSFADQQLSNLSGTTAFPVNLLPATSGNLNLGSATKIMNRVSTEEVSGEGGTLTIFSNTSAGNNSELELITGGNATLRRNSTNFIRATNTSVDFFGDAFNSVTDVYNFYDGAASNIFTNYKTNLAVGDSGGNITGFSGTNNISNAYFGIVTEDGSSSKSFWTGTGAASGGNSGDYKISVGTATGTRGKIFLIDGSEGTAGECWKSTGTGGEGNWDTCGGGGGSTFSDSAFRVQDNGDATKQLALEVSSITTGTTRTWTVPDTALNFSTSTSGTFATNTLGNLGTTAFNADIIPATNNARDIGSDSARIKNLKARTFIGYDPAGSTDELYLSTNTGDLTLPDGSTAKGVLFTQQSNGRLGIYTTSQSTGVSPIAIVAGNTTGTGSNSGIIKIKASDITNGASTAIAADVQVTAGNGQSGGTGGSVVLTAGTGGTRGTLRIVDTTQDDFGAGAVWTETDTSGNGGWSRPSGLTLNTNTTQTGNTAATETDLLDYTMAANTLAVNGQAFVINATGTFANTISTDKRVKVKLGATTIFDSGALSITSAASWNVNGTCIRTGSATQKCSISFETSNSTFQSNTTYSSDTEDLTTALHIKITGNGTNANDTVYEMGKIQFAN